jgi:hypothetical protein
MELLNRYLHAVGARLPDAYQEDIVAELRQELLSRIEEREAGLQRPLTEAEVVSLLKACGHPLVVAASYVHGQHLITPALLPFYRFAAQVVIGADLLAHFIYIVGALIFHKPLGQVLSTAWNSLWIVTMYLLGTVTFSALLLDRIGAAKWLAKAWSPRYLPRSSRRRPASVILALDCIAVLGLAAWVSGILPVLTWFAWPLAVRVKPIALWSVAGAVLLLVALAQLATHVAERWTPRLALPCLLSKLIQNVVVLSLAGLLTAARPWVHVSGLDVKALQAFQSALQFAMAIGVGVVTASAAVALAVNARRLSRQACRWASGTAVVGRT